MRFQHAPQILFSVRVLRVDVLVDVKLSVFKHDRFVSQFNRYGLVQFYSLRAFFVLQVRGDRLCQKCSVFEALLSSNAKSFTCVFVNPTQPCEANFPIFAGDLPP